MPIFINVGLLILRLADFMNYQDLGLTGPTDPTPQRPQQTIIKTTMGAKSMRDAAKTTFAILIISLVFPCHVLAGSATLHWQANTEPDLAGYRIYYGTSSRSYGSYIPVDKDTTSYTIKNLTEGRTYYFALTAVDTSGNESGYSQEVWKTIATQEPTVIPLPAVGNYGNLRYGNGRRVPGGDVSHVNEVKFSFEGIAGDVALEYEAWDVDNSREVKILINGRFVGYVPVTGNERWSGKNVVLLPDTHVKDTGQNIVTFSNSYNPPRRWGWGVRNVQLK